MHFFGVFSPIRLSKHHKTALASQFAASLLLMMIFVVLVLVFNRHGVSHGVGQGMLLMSVASLSLDVSEVSRIANLSEWSVVTNETLDFFENLFIKRYFVKRN